uniref:Uncharacterized protein n=1 Tax=Arundo donax TaxID=35708 RepID=A0A0A9H6U0_ARUDO
MAGRLFLLNITTNTHSSPSEVYGLLMYPLAKLDSANQFGIKSYEEYNLFLLSRMTNCSSWVWKFAGYRFEYQLAKFLRF